MSRKFGTDEQTGLSVTICSSGLCVFVSRFPAEEPEGPIEKMSSNWLQLFQPFSIISSFMEPRPLPPPPLPPPPHPFLFPSAICCSFLYYSLNLYEPASLHVVKVRLNAPYSPFSTTLYHMGCRLCALMRRANAHTVHQSPPRPALCSLLLMFLFLLLLLPLSTASEDANIYRKPPVYRRQGWLQSGLHRENYTPFFSYLKK